MATKFIFHRGGQYRMTGLHLNGPQFELEVKLLSQLGARERRAIARSFLRQMKPWLRYFTQVSLDHSTDGWVRDKRNGEREVKIFLTHPITSIQGRVGFEIRMARLKFGITQAQLARKAGIRRAHLSDIERGRFLPNSRTRERIEKALESYFDEEK